DYYCYSKESSTNHGLF
nr:immunoglobulin light chain junction region [Macaca mulatta]MOX42460.1 immunoglobulin light chain junction region [Macaca mulatta]MOX42665.1 immunoglobulin light chain junction region [Macaca mulatta]MOX43006.1 immunoglobulin light chain junction region [Macaca mulatta]MOX43143.1 immunoglobulin light chain junction region [Macaca mulatta]